MEIKVPCNIEAERALIGGIFYNEDIFDEVRDIVKPEDFYKVEYTTIFKVMEELYSESKGIDPILINDELKKLKNREELMEALNEIVENVVGSYNLIEYANSIKQKAMLRRLGNIGTKITESAYKDDRAAEDIVDEAEAMVLNLSNKILKNSIVNMKMAGVEETRRLDRITSNRGKTLGIPTGFVDLDRMTSGLNNSDLIILAARPAMGKTAFALNLVLNAAKEKKAVLVFSLEMGADQLYRRLLCMEAGIEQEKLKNGYLDDEDWNKYTLGTSTLANTEIFVADLPNTNILEIRSLKY